MIKLAKIKAGFIVSYDYAYLFNAIAPLYSYANKIVLAIDENNLTWSGNKFVIPQSFFEAIRELDRDNKIELYFDNFYIPELTPMECETRERNMLLNKLGNGGWKLQLDVDEYIYDFNSISKFLHKNWYFTIFPRFTPMQFRGKLITLFKQVEDGFLYIDNEERFTFITNGYKNDASRVNTKRRSFYTNIAVIHQSWARNENEILTKILNWGHRDDFDTMSFFEYWKKLDNNNYQEYINFHPFNPKFWQKLEYIRAANINEFITTYSNNNKQQLNRFDLTFLINKIKMKFSNA